MKENLILTNDCLDLLMNSEDFNFNVYVQSISNLDLLSEEEEKELGIKILNGDKSAEKELVEHNLRLVIFFAKDYLKSGMDILDLIQDGNLGLIKAAEKFDVRKGFKFSTYASNWITQYIKRGINNREDTIRIPSHIHEKIEKFYHLAIKENLFTEDKDKIDTNKISQLLNLKVNTIEEILNSKKNIISLDLSTSQSSETRLEDLIADENSILPEEHVERSETLSAITKSLAVLNEKEQKVILYRFGFYNNKPQSLEEISKKFGVTRERIRQIENKALKTLRSNPNIIKQLAAYK